MRLESFRAALQLLTRIPVSSEYESRGSRGVSPRMVAYFPLVGVVVGGVGVLTWIVTDSLVGPFAAAVASVLATIAVTGALHEDGLADTLDGLFGGGTAERRLEIMRDSRLGTFGVLALLGELLQRTALLVPLGMPDVARAIIAGHVIGRAAPLVLATWLPAARPDGLGASVLGPLRRRDAWIAGVAVAVVALVAAGLWAPLLVAAAAVPLWLLGRAAQRRIGGFTGDVLGAGVLLVNLAVTATVAALARGGAL